MIDRCSLCVPEQCAGRVSIDLTLLEFLCVCVGALCGADTDTICFAALTFLQRAVKRPSSHSYDLIETDLNEHFEKDLKVGKRANPFYARVTQTNQFCP